MATSNAMSRALSILVRWLTFNAVGVMGAGVQLVALITLTEGLDLDYLLATGFAVEAAIIHNFVWHEQWTWGDRVRNQAQGRWERLARFNLVSGALAITGNIVFTGLYATSLGIHYALANLLAIASCSLANFVASEHLVFGGGRRTESKGTTMQRTDSRRALRTIGSAAVGALLLVARADAAELNPQTVGAWSMYVQATEQRITDELASDQGFLVQDLHDESARARAALRRGDVLVTKMETRDADGSSIGIPRGAVHHWRGRVFIPGVSLDDVLYGVKSPLRQEDLQEDVLESRVLEREGDRMKVFLKLKRKKFVTVHYNTEHVMRYARHDGTRASSSSIATKIAELTDVGSTDEREKPIGNDRGFLWRLNSYWRYEEVDGGVIVECESLSLSRSIPAVVRWMVTPLINSAAHESMERTLTSMRARLLGGLATPMRVAESE